MLRHVIVSFALLLAMPAALQASERPNILFIAIDDLRPEIAAYGAPEAITPHLDQVANEGRVFLRHYVQVATCGPSREALLTGKPPYSTPEIRHSNLFEELLDQRDRSKPETFVELFRRNGYTTVGIGKISHANAGLRQHDGARVLELPHSWTQFIHDTGWPGQGSLLHTYSDGLADRRNPVEAGMQGDLAYPDGYTARAAEAALESLAKNDEPFLLAVGFYKPHLPFTAPQEYWDLYDRSSLTISSNPAPPIGLPRQFLHNSSEFNSYAASQRPRANHEVTPDYARELRHAYLASVSYVDAQVGKVLAALESHGLAEDTIVIVWGDHGWHLGDHTIWGKHSALDRAVHSPLIVRQPGMLHAGHATEGLVASIDIYPTLLELADLQGPDLPGRSFAALLDDPMAQGRDAVFSYWRRIVSMRTDRYRLLAHSDGKQLRLALFDHDNDTAEMHNIAANDRALTRRLLSQLAKGNTGIIAEDIASLPIAW